MPRKTELPAEDTAMKKSVVQTFRSVSGVHDRLKNTNPLLMRKKFAMKDVFFRRNQPDVELFRAEVAFDLELYVIIIALLAGSLCLFLKTARFLEHRRYVRLEKALLREKK